MKYTFLKTISVVMMILALIVLIGGLLFGLNLLADIFSRQYAYNAMRSDDYLSVFYVLLCTIGISLIFAGISEVLRLIINVAKDIRNISTNTDSNE